MNEINKEYTYYYRDLYNEQCECPSCIKFRNNFKNKYPKVADYLEGLGIDIQFPIEIMDLSMDEFIVYYAVKGKLKEPKLILHIEEVELTMRDHETASEAYANTGMKKPFFIIEVSNIFIIIN
ncbi:hypothetical protein AN639_08010 [Candidatus Epulonipiscium fishelsonii]|uniref:Uncharacterized protein n=1 Tax=Candidatus Epulonipiscium fishelsonii TaxID=77094 RepID=A0ACC8X6R0_9FIRM|nr:hypothetical protein AN396_12720 [Epulopiscium sp. SCG-B11WGA-EpuloA1]ONI38333.1 hypothetical protein AN639_08010 [Epulopiscium sp. SCG-B05WGA-EpuloA1]